MSLFSLLVAFCTTVASAQQQPLKPLNNVHGPRHYPFDPLKHLPGISPYFDAQGFGLSDDSPLGCTVTAASYLVRHSAIYANDHDYETFMEPFLQKLNKSNREDWTGVLSVFRNGWTSPITDPKNQLEQLTPDGAESATRVGAHLLERYPDLVPTTKKVYYDKKSRTKDTAEAFVKAFPQVDDIELIQISKEDEFHAIIPHKFCPNFSKSAGDAELEEFANFYTKATISRLQPHAPFNLTTYDIIGLQQMCGYESAITGKFSELCDIFTPLEWLQYEYLWDVKYSYMVGPGQKLSPYLGFPWLNVTADLFLRFNSLAKQDDHQPNMIPHDDGQRFFVSITHREVPPFLATALGLFNSSSDIKESTPTDRVNFGRSWRMSELIPFLGHIGIEMMLCDRSSGALEGTEYVRIMANSAPRPIPQCQSGPGASCSFQSFIDFISNGLENYGDFQGVCGVKDKSKPIVWR